MPLRKTLCHRRKIRSPNSGGVSRQFRIFAQFRWQHAGVEQRLSSNVHIQREDGASVRLLFSGGELAAKLLVDARTGSGATCDLDMDLAHQPVVTALRTLDVLEALRQGAGVEAYTTGERVWHLAEVTADFFDELPALRRQLSELSDVAAALGTAITVPNDSDRESWQTSALLAIAVKKGRVLLKPRLPFSIVVPRQEAMRFEEIMGVSTSELVLDVQRSWKIDGVTLDVGVVRLRVVDPKISARVDVGEGDQSMVRFEFSNETVWYVFERWLGEGGAAAT